MTNYYKRGDVVLADLDPVIGSEQGGSRPVLIIQNDIGNKYSNTIITAAITTSCKKELPTHIALDSYDFLESGSIILLEQIRTIDINRILKYLGDLPHEKMISVDRALAISVGLKRKQPNGLVMTLCPNCVQAFYDSPYHEITRLDHLESVKESCTYCGARNGFDYLIKPIKKLENSEK